jgi:hypothetical protein
VFVDDWRSMRLARSNFRVSSVTDVVGLTHTGLVAGQHHRVSWVIMSPWVSIAEQLKMAPEANGVMGFVLRRGVAGDGVAWDISCYCMDLERLA